MHSPGGDGRNNNQATPLRERCRAKDQNLSRIDFDELTIISAEGDRSRIVRGGENLYKTAGTGAPYYFITMTKSRLSLSSQSGVTPLILRCCCASRPHSRRIYSKPYFIAPIHNL